MYEEKCSKNEVVRVYLYATATIAAAAAAVTATETAAVTVKRTCTKLCKLSGIWHNGIAYLFLYIVMAMSHRVRMSEWERKREQALARLVYCQLFFSCSFACVHWLTDWRCVYANKQPPLKEFLFCLKASFWLQFWFILMNFKYENSTECCTTPYVNNKFVWVFFFTSLVVHWICWQQNEKIAIGFIWMWTFYWLIFQCACVCVCLHCQLTINFDL